MAKIPTPADISALASLLADADPAIAASARDKLLSLTPDFMDYLKTLLHGDSSVLSLREEARLIWEERHFLHLKGEFREWARKETDLHLEQGAILLSKFASPEVNGASIQKKLEQMTREVKDRLVKTEDEESQFYTLNQYLFRQMGFKGNTENYYEEDNSYLHRVLERKVGIPISLSVVLLALGQRLGLPLRGVGMPGHFIVKFEGKDSQFFVDAFGQGRILSREDCKKWLVSGGFGFQEEYLALSSDLQILARMLKNLISIYTQRQECRKVQVLNEFLTTVCC